MLRIKLVGRDKPLWTEKVEMDGDRISFETHTLKGKIFKHSILGTQVLEIVDLGALDENEKANAPLLPED